MVKTAAHVCMVVVSTAIKATASITVVNSHTITTTTVCQILHGTHENAGDDVPAVVRAHAQRLQEQLIDVSHLFKGLS